MLTSRERDKIGQVLTDFISNVVFDVSFENYIYPS